MPTIDVKKLLIRIDDEKDLHADLCLDLDCRITAEDPKPLIRSINYIVNYLSSLSTQPLHIGLSAQNDRFIISFLAHPVIVLPPVFREDAADVLDEIGISIVAEVRPPEYAKVLLMCTRPPAAQ